MNAHPKGDTNNQPARMTRTLDTQPGRHHIHPNKPANTQDEAAPRHNTQTCAHPLHAYPLPLYQAQTVLTPPIKPTQAAHPSSPHRTNTPPLYAPSLTPHPPLNNHPQKTPNHKTNILYTRTQHIHAFKRHSQPHHTPPYTNKRHTPRNRHTTNPLPPKTNPKNTQTPRTHNQKPQNRAIPTKSPNST